MKYMEIRPYDVSNGEGVRVTIFCTGCEHNCEDCFNKELWSFNAGEDFTPETMKYLMECMDNENVVGINILGGEPMHYKNKGQIAEIILNIKKYFQNKTIWLWTGFTFEELVQRVDTDTFNILSNIDVLIDGKYEKCLRDISLKYRGSSNQRVIDMKKTLAQKKIVLFENNEVKKDTTMEDKRREEKETLKKIEEINKEKPLNSEENKPVKKKRGRPRKNTTDKK